MKTHVLQFSDPRKPRLPLLCIFPFLPPFHHVGHTNNADHTTVLSFPVTAALLLSATSLVMDVSSFLRGTGKITALYYKSHRVNAYQWVWNSTYQTTNSGSSKLERKMGMGERRKGNCHFFLNSYTSESLEFFHHKYKSCIIQMQQLKF